MSYIEPKPEHLSDPYVLQLIETIGKQDDRIEELESLRRAITFLLTATDQPIDPVDGYCGRKSSKQGLQAGEADE